jgi:hypothetical protein
MSRESLVFLIGVLVLLVPFLGLPRDHKDWILVGAGIILIISGYQLRRKRFLASLVQEKVGERKSDAFIEHLVETSSVAAPEQEIKV